MNNYFFCVKNINQISESEREGRVCKFFNNGKLCYRGDNCPYEHILLDDGKRMLYNKYKD